MNTAREVFENIAAMMNAVDRSGKFAFCHDNRDISGRLHLLRVLGSYEDEPFLALEWSEERGWYVVEDEG